LYAFIISRMRATSPAYLILLHLITLVLGDEYKFRSSPSCNFLQSPVASFSSLGPNILLSTLLKHPQSLYFP